MGILDEVEKNILRESDDTKETRLPFVTVSYAQSLDGSIALRPGYSLAISCSESLALTHTLRAIHDAVLVGIGTVLADDPRLTVRMTAGQNPQPVVLDSRLRFPSYARLLEGNGHRPWIFTTQEAEVNREKSLEASGALVLRLPSGPDGRIEVKTLLKKLAEMQVKSLMVEGGAQVINSFLLARAVNQIVVCIAPVLVGGLRVIDAIAGFKPAHFPRLINIGYEQVGDDLVLRADPRWT
ncbi:MAG: RibD family protein [Thermodesulfobacteriota bacterium]